MSQRYIEDDVTVEDDVRDGGGKRYPRYKKLRSDECVEFAQRGHSNDVTQGQWLSERDPSPPVPTADFGRDPPTVPARYTYHVYIFTINTYYLLCVAIFFSHAKYFIYLIYYILFYFILHNYSHCTIIIAQFVARDNARVTRCREEGRKKERKQM